MRNEVKALLIVGFILLVGCVSDEKMAATTQPAAGIDLVESTETTLVATAVSTVPATAVSRPTPTNEAKTGPSSAANADVTFVRAVQTDKKTWTFYVTVAHPDAGWDDYADGWDVVLPDGAVVRPDAGSPFTRILLHPHDAEQPFTRSQSGIVIPPDVTEVTVRAHDLVDGFGGQEVVVDLTAVSGPNFEVEK